MLKSFVSERDYPLLLDILEKVKLGTLKETVSVLNIYGDYYSGKTVLCEIMKKIAPSYDKSYIEAKIMTSFLHTIVFVSNYIGNDKNELVDKIHRRCNTGMLFERFYKSDAGIHHPGVLVIPSSQKLDIKVGDPEKMILEPLSGTPFRDSSEEINY